MSLPGRWPRITSVLDIDGMMLVTGIGIISAILQHFHLRLILSLVKDSKKPCFLVHQPIPILLFRSQIIREFDDPYLIKPRLDCC
jgi:hypothetical protein